MNEQQATKAMFRLKKLPEWKKWLSTAEVASVLCITREWCWHEIDTDVMKSKVDVTRGTSRKYRLVHKKWLEEYINEKMIKVPFVGKKRDTRIVVSDRASKIIQEELENKMKKEDRKIKKAMNKLNIKELVPKNT